MNQRTGQLAVSVVVPTRNRPAMLERALRSVLAQTFLDFEVVVVDDGSTPPAADVVERLCDPRLRLLRFDPGRGAGAARNAGIAEARGEWIAFLDDDDEWLPEKLSVQMARVESASDPRMAVVYSYCEHLDATGKRRVRPKQPLPEGDVFAGLVKNLRARTPSVYLIKRSALVTVGGFDDVMPSADDLDLWFRLADAEFHFAAVLEPLAIKHEHGGEQITKDPIAGVIGSRMLERRWGPAIERRLGAKARGKWRRKRLQKLGNQHGRHLDLAVSAGDRAGARRYAWRMLPYLPWGTRFVARALAFGVLGLGSPAER